MSASPEDIARVKWNRSADMHNQWETLDDEEKRELIARESPPVVAKLTPKRVTPEMVNDQFPARYKLIGGGRAGKTEAVRIMVARGATNLLPENPTRFDYLHAIRAIASRSGADEIYHLADAAMQVGDAERPPAPAKLTPKRLTPEMMTVTPPAELRDFVGIRMPAARPTPITDAFVNTVFNGLSEDDDYAAYVRTTAHARDLERQLAESKSDLESQREVIALQYGEIDNLRDKLAKSDHEVDRLRAAVDDSNIAELNRQLAEAREELAETAKDYQCLASRLDGHDATECRMNLDRLIARLSERTSECEEQARLLGMSGEREARLIAQRDALVEALRRLVNMKDERSIQDISNEELDNWRLADDDYAAVKGGSHE